MQVSRIPRIRRFRTFSTNSSFTKLRAFPFKLSPADAIVQLGPHASAIAVFKGFIRSLGARFLPGFGFQPFQPTRIVPVYFPAWIIDAEVQVDISYNNTQRTSTAYIYDSYLPGSDFTVLSLVPLLSRSIKVTEAVPFSEELRHQYGTEVSCLPYTISPFTVLDIASSLSPRDSKVDDDVHFTPTSIIPNLFAAYPVLVPLYLAQYEYTIPGLDIARSFTMFIEASTPKGNIMADRFAADTARQLRDLVPGAPSTFINFTHLLDGIHVAYLRGTPAPFVQIEGLLTPDRRDLASKALAWLDDLLSSPGTAKKLASESGVLTSDEDPRIREYTLQERHVNLAWMKLGAEIASVKIIAETMANSTSHVVSIGTKTADSGKLMEGAIEGLETKRANSLPSWWKNWKEMSGGA